ncbi:MAG: hypothetical protein IV100_00315 [Myxococcales bacterium]|nr:hypothetical protein [Myxococcales bacterium]
MSETTKTAQTTTAAAPREIRAGELASWLPRLWLSEVGTALPGAPSMDGENRGYAEGWRRFTASVLATKLDCCVSSTYDGASVDGLNRSLAEKYLSTDPAAAFLVPTSVGQGDLSRFANGFRSVEGYGGADFDTEHESLLLEADDVVESSLFADAAIERRRADSLFARSPRRNSGKAPARRVAPAAVRPLSAPARVENRRESVVHAYPAAMGNVGHTPRSRVIQGLQALRLATQSGLAATPATLAMLGDAIARGTSWSEIGATVDAFRPGASASEPTLSRGANAPTPSGRLGAVTAGRAAMATARGATAQAARETMDSGATRRTARSLPALAAAMSVSDVAWPQAAASLAVSGDAGATPAVRQAPRSAGVFSPGRIAGALHVATLDGTPVRLLGRAQASESTPGYRSVEFDASEQSWLQLETGTPARFDAAAESATVRRTGRAVPAARAAAAQIARRLPAAEAARLVRETVASPVRPAATARPVEAAGSAAPGTRPVSGRDLPQDALRTATALPSVISAPVAELGAWTPERVNAEVRRQLASVAPGASARYLTSASTSPMGRVSSSDRGASARLAPRQVTVPELSHLVPAAMRAHPSGAAFSDVTSSTFSGGVSPTSDVVSAARAFTTGLRVGGITVSGTTTPAEVFAEHQRQLVGASLSTNLDAAWSPTSRSGEVRVSAGAYAGGFDDPVIYLALNERAGATASDPSLPPSVARAHRMSPSLRTSLDAVTAPLSQVVAAGPTSVSPRAAVAAFGPPSARGAGATRGVTITAADAGRSPLRPDVAGTVAAFEDRMSPLSARRQDGSPSLRAVDAASGEVSYYAVGGDLESAFLRLDVDHAAPMAGSHVELRQGRVVKMVPATASAARASRVQPAQVAERRMGLPSAEGPSAAEPGIRSGAVRTLSVGASRVERPTMGASAVLSAPMADHRPASLRATTALGDAAALPGSGSRPTDSIAAMLERLGGAATFATISSSAPQSAALERLATLVEAGGASARTAVAARLTALGMDVPELLRATREVSASRETDVSLTGALPTARRATGGATTQTALAERRIESARAVESLAASALARLSGLPSFGRSTPVVESDRYFGTFAPARLEQGSAAGRLASLLSGDAAPARESRLSVTAELGDMLRLREAGGSAAERLADSLTAADRVAGRSKQTLGAGMRVSTKQSARFDAATASAAAPVVAPAAGRVAGLPTLGLERPSVAQLTRELQSLPAGSLSSLVDRLGVAPEPWQPRLGQTAEAETTPSRVAHLSPEMPALGLRAFEGVGAVDSSSPATPRSAAARAAAATSGRANAPSTDGSRWFRALGPEAARQLLSSMPGRRALSSAIPGGLDLSATVIDRANGSFANLDAGIVEFLQSTAARLAAGEARDLRPGLDEWPEETLEILQAAGWGQGASPRTPGSVPGASMSESTVSRLERRVDAARQAWARVQNSRARGSQSRGVDSLNWDLVKAGTTREAPASADLGRLASTMVKQRDLPAADMAYVAPAVKVVAAQAQLSERPSGTGSSGPAQPAPAAGGESGSEPQKVDYMSLARRVLPILSRLKSIERDRRGG